MNSIYTIEPISKSNAEKVAILIAEEFYNRQPAAMNGTTTVEDFREYLICALGECAEKYTGFVARVTETDSDNDVVGAVIACDLADTYNSEEFHKEAEQDSLIAMLRELNNNYFSEHDLNTSNINKGYFFNIKFLAVSEAYSGKGIAVELLNSAIDQAASLGFRFAHTESVGVTSQYVFSNRMGFEEKGEIVYADFLFKDTKPFASIHCHKSIKLLMKEL